MARTPEEVKAFQKEYQKQYQWYHRERYHRKMSELKVLLGGKCVECGDTENLEFDHVDPKTKKFAIAARWKLSVEDLQDELDKCQLLCHDCHLEKTRAQRRSTPTGVV